MPEVTRRSFLTAMGAGAGALSAPEWLRAAAPRKPNIIFLLGDDVGLDLISCYGSDHFKTPHIDALARTGVRFETCYSTPLCGPTRCEFLTGRYPFRTGGLANGSWNVEGVQGPNSHDEVSIAKPLKQVGYATCSSGKWRQVGETPGDWGFDEWLTDETAHGWYWQKTYTKNGKFIELDKAVYCPDVAHDFAMDFLRRHTKEPFFLYYPMHLIHAPVERTPDSAASTKDFYADMVAYMDRSVGKVVAEIDRLGLAKDTLIIYAGDNGTARQSATVGGSGTIGGRQINGAKMSMREGGSRVPMVAAWKGTTPQGKVLKDMVDFSDFYTTFAELAGAKLPAGVTMDGHSFAPQLRGQKGNPREWAYVQLGSAWYVREAGWKLNQGGNLYDMREAPFQERLVSADTQDAAAAAARKRLQAVLDGLNPAGGKTAAVRPGAAKDGQKARKGSRKKAAN